MGPEPNQEAARTLKSASVAYPLTSDDKSITVEAFMAIGPAGEVVSFPAAVIGGLDELARYGVFWRSDVGYVVEIYPAPNNMAEGSYYFIGWMSTSDVGGEFPSNPTPPGGWGGNNEMVIRE